MTVIREAKSHIPNEPSVHFNLANMLGQKDEFVEAAKHFLIALKLKPNSAEIYGNLGVLYHRWGKHEQASIYYRKALKLDPQSENVHEN